MSQGSRLPVLQSHSQRETSYAAHWSANPIGSFFKTGPEPATSYNSPHHHNPQPPPPSCITGPPAPTAASPHYTRLLTQQLQEVLKHSNQRRCFFAQIPAVHFQDTPSRRRSPVAVDLPVAPHPPGLMHPGPIHVVARCHGATTPTCLTPTDRGPRLPEVLTPVGSQGAPSTPSPI